MPRTVLSCDELPTTAGPGALDAQSSVGVRPKHTPEQVAGEEPQGSSRRSDPRAASSHSSSLGRRLPCASQYLLAPSQVTAATGSSVAAASQANWSPCTWSLTS